MPSDSAATPTAATLAYDDAGTGVPIVLLHAFPLNSQMWEGVRAAVGRAGRLVTLDLAGFGRSAPASTAEPSLDELADEVITVIERLGLEQVVLGGVSMGGYVAMALLRRAPDLVRALVLADTKATADTDEVRANRERIAATALREGTPRVVLDDVVPGLLGPTTHQSRPHVVSVVRELAASASPEAIAWAQRAMAARPDSIETLRAFTGPALVVVGEEDGVTPPAEATAMAAALPDAQLVRLPEAGHLAVMETPDPFAVALRAFLARL